MEHRLIELLLFTGVLPSSTGVLPFILSLPRKYVLIQQNKTWSDAQAYCRDTYTDLAIINTNEEMIDLQTAAQKQQFSSSAWIGLYSNIKSWNWSMNNETLGGFRSWADGEPNNIFKDELCVFMSSFKWYDAPCSWALHFVCFDDTKTDTEKYVLISQRKSWDDAQIYCRQHHTDLASVRDATENTAVGGMNPTGWIWIGLRRDPWKWTDQTTDVSAITWQSEYSVDVLYNKRCVYLNGGRADEEQCSNPLPFFCYAFPKQQQTIRLKFNSSVDMNDPAIMASIQEKLKKKLEEHGVTENITVTWRKQPDGEVFHKEEQNTTAFTNTREAGDL